MNTNRAIAGVLAIALVGLVACKTPRQRCYEENRCDSADAECMGIMAMLTGMMTGATPYAMSESASSNNTLSQADYTSSSSATATNGTMSTSTDAYDVYYIAPYSSTTISAKMTATAGSPACYAYANVSYSSDTSANPKGSGDGLWGTGTALTSTARSFSVSAYKYLYIVCVAGSTSDSYSLTTTPSTSGSFDYSSFLMLMCVGSSATCEATCNTQYSY